MKTVILSLLIGVLAATVCVLWFLNIAVNNQREASRRKLADAYRGQLVLLRNQADSFWEKRGADLERDSREGAPAKVFERIVTGGLADSAICLNADGSAAYPASTATRAADSTYERADWMAARTLETWGDLPSAAAAYAKIAQTERDISVAARAAQAQVRCLVKAGDKRAAVKAIEANFDGGRLMRGVDPGGRLIAADELLLATQLGDKAAPAKLRALVADYAVPLPSAQRLFLMDELGGDFPTRGAERLAAQFLEKGDPRAAGASLQPGGVPEVWRLAAPGGRALGLYRTATIAAAMHGLSTGLNAGLEISPPGSDPPRGSEPTSVTSMPGWQISLTLADADQAARRQTASYIWIGLLAIAVVAATAVFAGRAMQRQSQLARLKADLVAAVSHELKTPLASMQLLVDTLMDDEAPDAAKTHDYLELMARENSRLSRLIENFLTFSRLERNRQKFEFRATDPGSVVQAAVDAVRERFRASECDFEVSVSPGLARVRGDEDALVTVLVNLLDNAYKYTPDRKHIAVRASGENGRVRFEVEDNGIGIAPRERKKIFRRFYQVDRRLAREAGGCGLGLSIVDSIVRAHGGTVEVQSEPGKGSTFYVSLPAEAV